MGTATPDSVEDVFLGRCADEGVVPILLRPERLGDAPGEMHPGTPRPHASLPHASYSVSHRPSHLGDPLMLDVRTPRTTYGDLAAKKPIYQAANIACAVALCEGFCGRSLDGDALRASVAACPTPGRFDVVSTDPLVMIDACHNPQSVQTFLAALREIEPDASRRPQLLCAVLADKDVAGIVRLLAHEFPRVSVTRTSSPRAISADDLADLFRAEGVEPAAVYRDVPGAVAALRGEPFVACGSITTAGEVAALFGR